MKKVLKKIGSVFNFKHEPVLKIVSVLLALVFWVFVMDQENPITSRVLYSVPVSYVGEVPADYVVVDSPNYYSSVEIKGRRNAVLAARPSDFTLTIDLTKLREGSTITDIQSTNILEDVEIVSLKPSTGKVVIEKIISESKPVQYALSSKFEDSLARSVITLSPSEVVVSGARSVVNRVKNLQLVIDAASIGESKIFEAVIVPRDNNGGIVEDVRLGRKSVTVTVQAIREKAVRVEAKYEAEIADGFAIESFVVPNETAIIYGDANLVDSISVIEAEPPMITGSESIEDALVFNLPEGVFIQEPEKLVYRATIKPIVERELFIDGMEMAVENLGEGLVAEITPPPSESEEEGEEPETSWPITILIRGLESEIRKIHADDFELSVDLAELTPGVYEVPVIVKAVGNAEDNEKIEYEVTLGEMVPITITEETEEE